MSIQMYEWSKTSKKDFKECISWCKEKLNLRDWQIALYLSKEPPDYLKKENSITFTENNLGRMEGWENHLSAGVWLNIEKMKKENYAPLATLVHEIIHIVSQNMTTKNEYFPSRFAGPIYELFCLETGRKFKKRLKKDFIRD